MSKKKVVVCMPVQNSVQADTVQCLIDLLGHRNVIGRAQVTGTLVHKARNKLIESALNGFKEATHILFVDDDMVFTNDDLDKLLDSGKDVIGSVCVERNPPFHPCLVPKDKDWSNMTDLWEKKKPIKVEAIGMGFTLVKIDILKQIMEKVKQPFFFEKDSEYGEDFNFCSLLKGEGETVWAHCDSQVGHISKLAVSLQHFLFNLKQNPATEELRKEIFSEDKIQES